MNKRIILITGVAQGLGRYLAECFSKHNDIIGIDLKNKEDLDSKFLETLSSYYSFDLSRIDLIEDLMNSIIEIHKSIDVLINNAGIKSFKPLDEYNQNEIAEIFNVNLLAPIILTKCVLYVMRRNNYGRIINISSNAAFKGYNSASIYSSTKGGMNLFTESLSEEFGKSNITINSICPSTIATPEYAVNISKNEQEKLVKPVNILNIITNIIKSNMNGAIIPVINYRSRLKYLYYGTITYLKWLIKKY